MVAYSSEDFFNIELDDEILKVIKEKQNIANKRREENERLSGVKNKNKKKVKNFSTKTDEKKKQTVKTEIKGEKSNSIRRKKIIKARTKVYKHDKIKEEESTIQKIKKKISRPKIKSPNRLTYTKRRNIFNRISLQRQYNQGRFEDIERDYKDGRYVPYIVEQSRIAKNRRDRILYKEIQEYEDLMEDESIRNGIKKMRVIAGTMLLAANLALVGGIGQCIYNTSTNNNQNIDIEQLTETQKSSLNNKIYSIEKKIGYELSELDEDEKMEAIVILREVIHEKDILEFERSFYKFQDQEFLEQIVMEAYEDEYYNLTEGEKENIREIAYMLLDKDCKQYVRDPDKVKQSRINVQKEVESGR